MIIFWPTVLVTILIDQFLKYLAVVKGIAVINQGISWGMGVFAGRELLVSIIVLLLLFRWVQKCPCKTKLHQVSWGLLLGAGLSNILDRFFYGGVVDWWRWEVFGFVNNLADVFIFLAIIGIIIEEFKNAKR